MEPIRISKMQLQDFYEIQNCLIEEFDDFWTPSLLKQELENKQKLNSYYFVAKQNNEIVGFVGVLLILDEMNIMNIVVRKNKRNCGIGSMLLKYIISFSKQKSVSSITLEVNEKNTAATALYKKYNFQEVGVRKKYYHNSDNAILMTCQLENSFSN